MEEDIRIWLDILSKVVGSSGNSHSERARVLDMWFSGYCQTVESPRSIDRKASIPLQQYLTNLFNLKNIVLIFTLIYKPLTRW